MLFNFRKPQSPWSWSLDPCFPLEYFSLNYLWPLPFVFVGGFFFKKTKYFVVWNTPWPIHSQPFPLSDYGDLVMGVGARCSASPCPHAEDSLSRRLQDEQCERGVHPVVKPEEDGRHGRGPDWLSQAEGCECADTESGGALVLKGVCLCCPGLRMSVS